jgi:hypothetical protein
MSQDAPQDITRKRVLYELPGTNAVMVRRDVEFRGSDGATLGMDLYFPADTKPGARIPAVVIVAGFPDVGYHKMLGCRFKEMAFCVSWARLLAASGLAAVAYTNREPAADLHALFADVHQHAASLGIDETRMGLWASSGNVPLALSALMQNAGGHLKCAALYYGYMLDLGGSTVVAEASAQWGFINPCTGKSVADLPQQAPLFIARAGRDQFAGLNDALDRFVAAALARNLPMTLVNHADAPHAFDLDHDSDTTREIVKGTLAFLRLHLLGTSTVNRPGAGSTRRGI